MGSSASGMWRCPRCHRRFAAEGQVHTCRPLGSLDEHFRTSEPHVRATFDRLTEVITGFGPVEILAQATRIAFHARMSFAVVTPRRRWLPGHLVLARVVDHPRFTRVTTYSARNHVHQFRLDRPDDVDDWLTARLAEAYEVGLQHHHRTGRTDRGGGGPVV